MDELTTTRSHLSLIVGGATLLVLLLLWFGVWPLGVEGEWTWTLIPHGERVAAEWLLSGLLLAFWFGFYVLVVIGGRGRLASASRVEVACWLITAVATGSALVSGLQDVNPEGYGREKFLWVSYYPQSSGYFYEARYDEKSLAEFLAGYEDKMREGDVLHVGTHPPGLFLLWRGVIAATSESETLRDAALDRQSEELRAAGDLLEQNLSGSPKPLTSADRAALLWGSRLTQWAAVLTLVPLYLLIRRDFAPVTAWEAATLWPLVPAVAVFLPKSDALFPLLSVSLLLCWRVALDRRSVSWATVTGLTLALSMTLTLAFLPIAIIGVAMLGMRLWFGKPRASSGAENPSSWTVRSGLLLAGGVLGGLLLWLIAFRVFAGVNLVTVWRLNLANHAGFYEQFPRTYWKWLLYNPLELILFAGLPIVVAAVAGSCGRVSEDTQTHRRDVLCVFAVWVLLWVSGKNNSEAGRLWLFLDPLLLWAAAATLSTPGRLSWRSLFGWQAAFAIGVVTRVFGFHFGG